MIRILLFILTNISILVTFSIILNMIGVHPSDLTFLIMLASIFGLGGSLISLYISKFLALNSVNGKIIENPSNNIEHKLLSIVCEQAKKLKISMPQVAIYESLDMNAFATGAKKNSSLIAVSTGLLDNMNLEEIEAVIAHEISHISNGDMLTMTLIQGVMNTFVFFISRILAQLIINLLPLGDEIERKNYKNSIIYFFISSILEGTFGILASLITLRFSRQREYYADAGSAKLVGKRKMISALQKLKISFDPEKNRSISVFCIHGKTKKNRFYRLFMSHPSLEDRIRALQMETYLTENGKLIK